MRAYIDFDDVLFDTAAFKAAYKKAIVDSGVDETVFENTYAAARNRVGIKNYSQRVHLALIEEKCTVSAAELERAIDSFVADTSTYLFPESLDFLAAMKEMGELYAVSFGTEGWQEKKIHNSGVAPYFREIISGEINKAEAISACPPVEEGDAAFFCDDRVEYINQVKSMHPTIHTILVKNPKARYDDKPSDQTDSVAYSLDEVLDIIKANISK